jgi:hypothetical protein
MVSGETGVGKGTLINYLNGVELTPVLHGTSWRLEAKKPLEGISISNSDERSDTFYPVVYSPPGQEFSYIDNPGFNDTRGVEYEVATAYFKKRSLNRLSK